MLSKSTLYHIWRQRLSQLIPEDCKYHRYRLTNMLLLVVGIYKARSVHLSFIAQPAAYLLEDSEPSTTVGLLVGSMKVRWNRIHFAIPSHDIDGCLPGRRDR